MLFDWLHARSQKLSDFTFTYYSYIFKQPSTSFMLSFTYAVYDFQTIPLDGLGFCYSLLGLFTGREAEDEGLEKLLLESTFPAILLESPNIVFPSSAKYTFPLLLILLYSESPEWTQLTRAMMRVTVGPCDLSAHLENTYLSPLHKTDKDMEMFCSSRQSKSTVSVCICHQYNEMLEVIA